METKLTKTQSDLLAVLRAVKADAEANEAAADAAAIGGLTAVEKFRRKGVIAHASGRISFTDGYTTLHAQQVRYGTFAALVRAGLAAYGGESATAAWIVAL